MFTHPEQFTNSPMLPTSNLSALALKILLVEDNLTNQKVALRQLQTLGYEASTVTNGRDAVEAVSQTCYDLVLMDCQMPIMDGYEATQAIRAREHAREHECSRQQGRTIIIAMTASDLPQDQERAIAVGMDDFLSKPVRRDALAAVLQRWSQVILASKNDSLSRQAAGVDAAGNDINDEQFQAHLDLEHLHLISDNSPEFELELLQLFTEDSLTYLQRLRQAILMNEFFAVEQAAHHIKGSSANVGAIVMQIAAEKLEKQAHQQNLVETDALITELASSLQLIQRFIKNSSL
jgi:CheY-like chemotaxis protein